MIYLATTPRFRPKKHFPRAVTFPQVQSRTPSALQPLLVGEVHAFGHSGAHPRQYPLDFREVNATGVPVFRTRHVGAPVLWATWRVADDAAADVPLPAPANVRTGSLAGGSIPSVVAFLTRTSRRNFQAFQAPAPATCRRMEPRQRRDPHQGLPLTGEAKLRLETCSVRAWARWFRG